MQELLDELRQTTDAKKRATIEQVLLVKRLPQLADRGAVADAARVLAANEEHLRSAASLALLTMLLELPHRCGVVCCAVVLRCVVCVVLCGVASCAVVCRVVLCGVVWYVVWRRVLQCCVV